MWDNSTLLQLLNSMPKTLEKQHIEKLQMLIDADKYKNQLISGFDLCGQYAPFCYECDKNVNYPCAVAYVKYMKAQGMDIEISQSVFGEKVEDSAEQLVNEAESEVEKTTDNAVANEKTKIRIAIARKKTLQ